MRRVTAVGIVPVLLLAVVAACVAPAAAQVYRWVDEYGVVHYGQGIDAVPERYRGSAVLQGYHARPAAPPKAEASPHAAAAGPTTIPYTPGQPIVVVGRLNRTATVRLLLDTGADRTLISPRALAAAGISLAQGSASGSIVGVTGSTEAPAVLVESLEVGQARVEQMLVVAYQMSEARHDGLLGRDFLDHFVVSLDAARGLVTLTPR